LISILEFTSCNPVAAKWQNHRLCKSNAYSAEALSLSSAIPSSPPGLRFVLCSRFTVIAFLRGESFPVIGGVSLVIRKHRERQAMKMFIAHMVVMRGITVSGCGAGAGSRLGRGLRRSSRASLS
jgi:hypothetical protein